jgi:hypothetical protein
MRCREVLFVVPLLLLARVLIAQQAPAVQISGTNIPTLQITAAELAKMPRLAVDVRNPHSEKSEHYEGVRLSELLAKAGVPFGEKLRGRALANYVVVQASDGYAAVYSIAEIDPAMNENRIILADKMDGKALGEHDGPFKIVAPGEKRPARWVRMVTALRIESAINPSGSSPQ